MSRNTVPNDIVMKQFWKITGFALFWVLWGVVVTLCISKCGRNISAAEESITERRDTVIINDTVTIIEPVPVSIVSTEIVKRKLPVSVPDTIYKYIERDSVEVDVPFTQKQYSDSTYVAWVSGYEPKLDSLKIFNQKEIITIETIIRQNQKQKHWHIGPTVGCGYTPKGFEPFVGISLTYSLISF